MLSLSETCGMARQVHIGVVRFHSSEGWYIGLYPATRIEQLELEILLDAGMIELPVSGDGWAFASMTPKGLL